jgi:hypothetical protein
MQRLKLSRSKRPGTKALQSEIKCRFRHGEILIVMENISVISNKNQLEVKGGFTIKPFKY